MILGVAIEKNSLLLAASYGRDIEPRFQTFSLDKGERDEGIEEILSVWRQAGDEALQLLDSAEQVVFALPAENCHLKRIGLESRLLEEKPEYLNWVAGNYLPGKLEGYHYGFIPLRRSFDGQKTEMLLYAITSKQHEIFRKLIDPENDRPVEFLPEQLGLVQVLELSLKREEFPQAGIVNCRENGIIAAYAKDGCYKHSIIFADKSAHKNDIAADIETYFLSRADISEPLPLVITGVTGCFTTSWSPIVPAFLGIHNLEYASSWGVADFIARFPSLAGKESKPNR